MPPETKRRAPHRNIAGLLITLVLHGAILGAVRETARGLSRDMGAGRIAARGNA